VAVVYARESASVSWSGGKTFVKRDQAWDSDSGLVRERPELFSAEPVAVAGRSRIRPVVERATRAPGEVRRTPPRTKKKTSPDGESDGATQASADE
jgi:hypothetical protein